MTVLSQSNEAGSATALFGIGLLAQTGSEAGVNIIVIGALFGAFCGFLFGLTTSQLMRYVSFLMGRNTNGYGWVTFSMFAGALLFIWLLAFGGKQ